MAGSLEAQELSNHGVVFMQRPRHMKVEEKQVYPFWKILAGILYIDWADHSKLPVLIREPQSDKLAVPGLQYSRPQYDRKCTVARDCGC